MKKSLLLLPVFALGLGLTSCGTECPALPEIPACPTCPTCPDVNVPACPVVATTFAEQCKYAGIFIEHEDPNAKISAPVEKPTNEADIDLELGVSVTPGSDYYGNGGSYWTYEQMFERFNMSYVTYYWLNKADLKAAIGAWGKVEDYTAVKTLAEAAKLDDAKYVTTLFPNDGTEYYLYKKANALSSKTLITASKTGEVSAAVYGLGMKKVENDYYVSGSITMKQNIKYLVETGKALMLVYEYNPTSMDKMGPGARNYGCRLALSLDTAKSKWLGADYSELEAPVKVGEAAPEAAGGISFMLKVEHLYTLG